MWREYISKIHDRTVIYVIHMIHYYYVYLQVLNCKQCFSLIMDGWIFMDG